MSTNGYIEANQERAAVIITAIESYEKKHDQFPTSLNDLTPYLSELTTTTDGLSFAYYPDNLDRYYLCFDVPQKQNLGCCFNKRLESWDYSFGD